MTLDLKTIWEPYSDLLPFEQVAKRLELLAPFQPEDPTAIIPAMVFQPDGPKLRALIVVTASMITELVVGGPPIEVVFDFVNRDRIFHVRWSFGAVSTAPREGAPAKEYKMVRCELAHGYGQEWSTSLSFFGSNPDKWIETVRACFPSDVVRKPLT